MCERFIENFTDKVVEKLDYEYCCDSYDSYYKVFDENLLKFIGRLYYRHDVEDIFYFNLAIYFFHRDVKSFVDILRMLHINRKNKIIRSIAQHIKNKHLKCSPENSQIVFLTYNNISWDELSYIYAEDENSYYMDKEKMNFNSWVNVFLERFI